MKLLTTKEAAKLLNRSVTSVCGYARRGILKSTFVEGKGYRFTQMHVEELYPKFRRKKAKEPAPVPNYYTLTKAAQILGIDYTQAQALICNNTFDATPSGRGWRVTRASVEAYQDAVRGVEKFFAGSSKEPAPEPKTRRKSYIPHCNASFVYIDAATDGNGTTEIRIEGAGAYETELSTAQALGLLDWLRSHEADLLAIETTRVQAARDALDTQLKKLQDRA